MGYVVVLLVSVFCAVATSAQQETVRRTFADPTRFAKSIAAFETSDRLSPPPAGGIVCTGSSSMRGWGHRISADLDPLTVIPRGFGGSNYYDLLHYADRVVLAYQPRAVLLYEGDIDVAAGIPAAQIHETFLALVARLRGRLPALRIYVIGAKPSIARWDKWPQMIEANALVRTACDEDPWMTYIDVSPGMLQTDGMPRPEIFVADNLHMNGAGYDSWRRWLPPSCG